MSTWRRKIPLGKNVHSTCVTLHNKKKKCIFDKKKGSLGAFVYSLQEKPGTSPKGDVMIGQLATSSKYVIDRKYCDWLRGTMSMTLL